MANPAQQHLRLHLEDLLGNLHYARRANDLGRLALLTYWEVRRWARTARQDLLAAHASKLITEHPHATREEFLAHVDSVIEALESLHTKLH